jgi:hypothetical protein
VTGDGSRGQLEQVLDHRISELGGGRRACAQGGEVGRQQPKRRRVPLHELRRFVMTACAEREGPAGGADTDQRVGSGSHDGEGADRGPQDHGFAGVDDGLVPTLTDQSHTRRVDAEEQVVGVDGVGALADLVEAPPQDGGPGQPPLRHLGAGCVRQRLDREQPLVRQGVQNPAAVGTGHAACGEGQGARQGHSSSTGRAVHDSPSSRSAESVT